MYLSVNPLLVVVFFYGGGEKNERYSGKLEFLQHVSTETRACPLLQPPQSMCFHSLGQCCGYVKGDGHTSDSQGQWGFKGNIKAVM